MVNGSCVCGKIGYEFDASAVQAHVACHCIPCRKSSGTPASHNLIVPVSKFKLTKGDPKSFSRPGDSGNGVTYKHCPTCSACLWVEAEVMFGVKIVKLGTVDDQEFLDGLGQPVQEIYCRNMWKWEKGVEGALQKQGAS